MKRLSSIAGTYFEVGKWLAFIGGVAIMIMCLYTTGDVVGRYVLNNPLPASFEITLILLIIITFFGITHTQAKGGHMRLEFLRNRVAPRGQLMLDILSVLIGLFLYSIITWQGLLWTIEALVRHEEMYGVSGIPYYPARLILTIGAFTLCVQYIIEIVQYFVQLFSKSPGGTE